MSKTPSQIAVEDIAKRLLTPKDCLDNFLFDKNDCMIPEIRQKLLNRAEFFIQETIGKIKGLQVKDIWLTGSATSYFYHKKSDIDIKVNVTNDGCPYLSKQPREVNEFCANIFYSFFRQGYRLTLDERLIDMKVSSIQLDIMGLYSILNDKWLIKPDKKMVEGITLDEVMKEFYLRFDEINLFLDKYKQNQNSLSVQDYEDLINFYYAQIAERNRTVKDYIVYKLINYHGLLRQAGNIYIRGQRSLLSV